jgi:hypothetical protein
LGLRRLLLGRRIEVTEVAAVVDGEVIDDAEVAVA